VLLDIDLDVFILRVGVGLQPLHDRRLHVTVRRRLSRPLLVGPETAQVCHAGRVPGDAVRQGITDQRAGRQLSLSVDQAARDRTEPRAALRGIASQQRERLVSIEVVALHEDALGLSDDVASVDGPAQYVLLQ
jgi:hypothetical protein